MSDAIVVLKVSELRKVLSEVKAEESTPYYTQDTSPLGRDRHCELLKAGVIKGWKHGRTWFARREDVHAWIESAEPAESDASPELAAISRRLQAAGGSRA